MTDLTDTLENAIMNWSFENTDMPLAPDNLFIALHTGDPTETGEANEVPTATTSYARVSVAAGTGFTTTGNTASNANEITFPTALESWGTISHFSVHTAADNATGDALWYSALDASKLIEANDEIRFDPGALTATIN